jgi:hypothetical protein
MDAPFSGWIDCSARRGGHGEGQIVECNVQVPDSGRDERGHCEISFGKGDAMTPEASSPVEWTKVLPDTLLDVKAARLRTHRTFVPDRP